MSASTSSSTSTGAIVLAEQHPRHDELKQKQEKSCSLLNTLKNTERMISGIGRGIKELSQTTPLRAEDGQFFTHRYFKTLSVKAVIIADPEIASVILRCHRNEGTSDAFFTLSPQLEALNGMLGEHTLLTASAEQHKELRTFAEQFFTYPVVKKQANTLLNLTDGLLKQWQETSSESSVVVSNDLMRFTADNIVKIYLSPEGVSDDVIQAVHTLSEISMKRGIGLPEFWDKAEFQKAMSLIDKAVKDIIEKSEADSFLTHMAIEKKLLESLYLVWIKL